MEKYRQESFVGSGLLGVLSVSLENQMKCDTLYSLLASEQMASSKFQRLSDASLWHGTFIHALGRCAWTLRIEEEQHPSFEAQASVTLKDMITQAMSNWSLHGQHELILEAFDSLTQLPSDSPIQAQLREHSIGHRAVKVPGAVEARAFDVCILLAVSAQDARLDLIYLTFESTESVGEKPLEQVFSTNEFTSEVLVKYYSFEQATKAFVRSRKQIVAFVEGHESRLTTVPPNSGVSQELFSCGAVKAPDSL